MSRTNTNIQIKRSVNNLSDLTNLLGVPDDLKDVANLDFGEPFFIDNTTGPVSESDPCNAYIVVGRKPQSEADEVTIKNSPVFKAFSQNRIGRFVFYDPEKGSIINEEGIQLPVNRLTTITKSEADLSSEDLSKYHILCQADSDNTVYKFALSDMGIFINGRGIMHGAAWNDYAETRPVEGVALPGQIVCDTGNGTVKLSEENYQVCAHVVSDTYGQLIGEKSENTVPIAVAGRVLVSVNEEVKLGDCICAGPNGIGKKMTRQEIISYPDRIIGVVCEIPKTEVVGSIEVNGRVWVNIK